MPVQGRSHVNSNRTLLTIAPVLVQQLNVVFVYINTNQIYQSPTQTKYISSTMFIHEKIRSCQQVKYFSERHLPP